MAVQYGYTGYYKPPAMPKVKTSGLALAAAGFTTPSNPYGFRTARNTTGYRDTVAAPRPPAAAPTRQTAPAPAVNPQAAQQQNTAPTPGGYDLNTDPALQQIQALAGMSDEQANAEAMKQRQQQLLAYGDPNLARSVLGDESFAQAAAGNPTSTLAQLGQQHSRNTHDLTEALNANNLLYGGYRVTQEQQAAQDYQNQLAQAAAGVNGNLDTISANLAAALLANQQQRNQALQDAANRAMQAAAAAGVPGGTGSDPYAAPPPETYNYNFAPEPAIESIANVANSGLTPGQAAAGTQSAFDALTQLLAAPKSSGNRILGRNLRG
jgi:hypothetical protein